MARMVQTQIRTTLRSIVFDGVPILRHAHVSNVMSNCNVHRLSCAASTGKCNHGKSHDFFAAIVAIDYRHSEMNIKYEMQLEQGNCRQTRRNVRRSCRNKKATLLNKHFSSTSRWQQNVQKTTMMYLLAWNRNRTQGYLFLSKKRRRRRRRNKW